MIVQKVVCWLDKLIDSVSAGLPRTVTHKWKAAIQDEDERSGELPMDITLIFTSIIASAIVFLMIWNIYDSE